MWELSGFLARLRPTGLVSSSACEDGVIVLTPSSNASVDYIVLPYLRERGMSARIVNARTDDPAMITRGRCNTVVIVRFLFKRWLPWLKTFHAAGGRVVYFMDDDLMDLKALHGLPDDYARAIRKFGIGQRARLEALSDEYWVASLFLAEKYKIWNPVVLSPAPSSVTLDQTSPASIFYHGTASHAAELAWLPGVIDLVQAARDDTTFEIFGDHSVNRIFKHIKRTAVLHPMSWESYLAYTASVRRDIGLAPLLPGAFNAARGPTKFFDFARMGALGIYSDVAPYRGFIRPNIDGVLLPNEPELWAKTVIDLVADPHRRNRMAEAARDRALSLAASSAATSTAKLDQHSSPRP